ncbi:hypothetical protein KUV65_10725 [Maritalea mobilis]|uniref:hypothetical protein n=1 Tax=Maritalea mobilis TaxID=483324 RepID=UPI001C965403|nr:hypothetical protein [Maritalea mobilis]MBY6201838.1 hypothetical protein [Maritalea mobilis]
MAKLAGNVTRNPVRGEEKLSGKSTPTGPRDAQRVEIVPVLANAAPCRASVGLIAIMHDGLAAG